MLWVSCWRHGGCHPSFAFRRLGAGLEAIAIVAGLEDVAAMGEAIGQGGGPFGIAKHADPFAQAQVGGDVDAGAFVTHAQQVEEQGAATGAERQISQLFQDHQVGFDQRLGELASLALDFFPAPAR